MSKTALGGAGGTGSEWGQNGTKGAALSIEDLFKNIFNENDTDTVALSLVKSDCNKVHKVSCHPGYS